MKTVNLELSRQLKEAGYPQETEFYWSERKYLGGDMHREQPVENLYRYPVPEYKDDLISISTFASPTADEILEQLPSAFYELENNNGGIYCLNMKLPKGKHACISANSLADAAAKMWLFLKKEGLL